MNAKEPIWKLLGEVPLAYAMEDGFDPETSLTRVMPPAVNRDQLLARSVLAYRGKDLQVRDLISYVANTAGGVHFDPPRDDRENVVQALAMAVPVGGYPAGSKTLLAVGRVVATGLDPLVVRVDQEHDVA